MVPEIIEKLNVGCRIDVNGQRGTIKYIGDVKGTQGEWIGVDWDDVHRGKHDGTHGGVSYFNASHPTSGSFIRPGKTCGGISCVEAIQRRYGLIEDNAGVDIHSIAQVQKDIRAKIFEVVGAEKINKKQSKFCNLEIVSLRGQLINSAGPPFAIARLCPNIRELDLSQTLINSWKTVAEIAEQLPKLKIINVSQNRFQIPDDISSEAFDSVEHLVLTRTALSWELVLKCCCTTRNLLILQAPFNEIHLISPADDILSNLSFLDLEGNPLGSWKEVNKLSTLKYLKTLNVSACSLPEVFFPSDEGISTTSCFSALESLIINENLIADWISISELDKLKSLVDVKCLKNPLLDKENFETNHQLIIARVKNLKVLNGVYVNPEERRGAEIDFLKRYGAKYLALRTEVDSLHFRKFYPCYQRLVDKYGPPEEGEVKKPPTCLKSNLIEVELYTSEKRFRKKLPQSMSVQKLMGLCQRLFNTGGTIPALTLIDDANVEVAMDELKDLNYYSVPEGGRIAVRW